MKIGIISDTHGYIHPKIFDFFAHCDEVWHAGDMVSTDILEDLGTFTKVRAVFGNCDGWDVRAVCNETEIFDCEEHKVYMKHIVGNPKRYELEAFQQIRANKPTIVVAGHSHILQVIKDEKNKFLFINPGAGGKFGTHLKLTFLRFDINGKEFSNLEVFESVR